MANTVNENNLYPALQLNPHNEAGQLGERDINELNQNFPEQAEAYTVWDYLKITAAAIAIIAGLVLTTIGIMLSLAPTSPALASILTCSGFGLIAFTAMMCVDNPRGF